MVVCVKGMNKLIPNETDRAIYQTNLNNNNNLNSQVNSLYNNVSGTLSGHVIGPTDHNCKWMTLLKRVTFHHISVNKVIL